MDANEKKTMFKSKSKNYVKIRPVGSGAFSNVFLVEEENSKEQ